MVHICTCTNGSWDRIIHKNIKKTLFPISCMWSFVFQLLGEYIHMRTCSARENKSTTTNTTWLYINWIYICSQCAASFTVSVAVGRLVGLFAAAWLFVCLSVCMLAAQYCTWYYGCRQHHTTNYCRWIDRVTRSSRTHHALRHTKGQQEPAGYVFIGRGGFEVYSKFSMENKIAICEYGSDHGRAYIIASDYDGELATQQH